MDEDRQEIKEESFLSFAPPEILLNIFSYTMPRDINNYYGVSSYWKSIIEENRFSITKRIGFNLFGVNLPIENMVKGDLEGNKAKRRKLYNSLLAIEEKLRKEFPSNPYPDAGAKDPKEATLKLCFASRYGYLPMARKLIMNWEKEVINTWEIQEASKMPASPLFLASQEGKEEVVKLLLESGADPNVYDKSSGVHPIHIATQQKHLGVMALLLKGGALPNISSEKYSLSPLYIACQNGFLEGAQLLLANGADIFFTYNNGVSCLFIAAQRNQAKICSFLMENGLSPSKARQDGMTPLSIAQRCNSTDALKVLTQGG